jgi:hypothetical protein
MSFQPLLAEKKDSKTKWRGEPLRSKQVARSPFPANNEKLESETRLLQTLSCSLLHEVYIAVPLQKFKIAHPVKLILRT